MLIWQLALALATRVNIMSTWELRVEQLKQHLHLSKQLLKFCSGDGFKRWFYSGKCMAMQKHTKNLDMQTWMRCYFTLEYKMRKYIIEVTAQKSCLWIQEDCVCMWMYAFSYSPLWKCFNLQIKPFFHYYEYYSLCLLSHIVFTFLLLRIIIKFDQNTHLMKRVCALEYLRGL